MSELSPRRRSSETVGFTDPPKELRSFHHNAGSDSLIKCEGLNTPRLSADTPFR